MARPRGATTVIKKLGDLQFEECESETGYAIRFELGGDPFVAAWIDGKFAFAYCCEESLTSRELSAAITQRAK